MAFPRISLAEVLVAAVVFCGFLAGLRFAGELAAQVAILVAALAFLYALMAAIFDRGSARAAGAGFAIGVALYGALFVAAGWEPESDGLGFGGGASHDELSFFDGALPTTNQSKSLYSVLAVAEWEQTDTGETMRITQDLGGTMYDPWGRVFDPASPAVPNTWRQTGIAPEPESFLAFAHAGWALLFGYACSLCARVAYGRGRRIDAAAPAPREPDRA